MSAYNSGHHIKLSALANKGLRLFFCVFGILLFLLVSNVINVPQKFIFAFNRDVVIRELSGHKQNRIEMNYGLFSKVIKGKYSSVGTDGIFNRRAQGIAVFAVGFSLLVLTSYLLPPPQGAKDIASYWARIACKGGVLLLCITALDYGLLAGGVAAVLICASVMIAGGLTFWLISWFQFKKVVFVEFCVILSLLVWMLVMNHSTYCLQSEYERPLMSYFSSRC